MEILILVRSDFNDRNAARNAQQPAWWPVFPEGNYREVRSTQMIARSTPVEMIPKSSVTMAVQAWESSAFNSCRVSALKEDWYALAVA
jgi:hypothetical protein